MLYIENQKKLKCFSGFSENDIQYPKQANQLI